MLRNGWIWNISIDAKYLPVTSSENNPVFRHTLVSNLHAFSKR